MEENNDGKFSSLIFTHVSFLFVSRSYNLFIVVAVSVILINFLTGALFVLQLAFTIFCRGHFPWGEKAFW